MEVGRGHVAPIQINVSAVSGQAPCPYRVRQDGSGWLREEFFRRRASGFEQSEVRRSSGPRPRGSTAVRIRRGGVSCGFRAVPAPGGGTRPDSPPSRSSACRATPSPVATTPRRSPTGYARRCPTRWCWSSSVSSRASSPRPISSSSATAGAAVREFLEPKRNPSLHVPLFDLDHFEYHHLIGYYQQLFGLSESELRPSTSSSPIHAHSPPRSALCRVRVDPALLQSLRTRRNKNPAPEATGVAVARRINHLGVPDRGQPRAAVRPPRLERLKARRLRGRSA